MKDVRICMILRVYDETGNGSEKRYDNMPCDNMPEDIMDDLIAGEVICIKLTPNVEAFYFKRPEDFPEDWTELGDSKEK